MYVCMWYEMNKTRTISATDDVAGARKGHCNITTFFAYEVCDEETLYCVVVATDFKRRMNDGMKVHVEYLVGMEEPETLIQDGFP